MESPDPGEPVGSEAPPEHGTPSDPEVSTEELTVALEQMVRYIRTSSNSDGLSLSASATLSRLGKDGPRRLTDLARAEGVTQPNMTQLVTRLEKAGLVRRSADASDGRGVVVEITDTGVDVVRRRRAERTEALQELIDELSEPERRAVHVALPALARVIRGLAPRA